MAIVSILFALIGCASWWFGDDGTQGFGGGHSRRYDRGRGGICFLLLSKPGNGKVEKRISPLARSSLHLGTSG